MAIEADADLFGGSRAEGMEYPKEGFIQLPVIGDDGSSLQSVLIPFDGGSMKDKKVIEIPTEEGGRRRLVRFLEPQICPKCQKLHSEEPTEEPTEVTPMSWRSADGEQAKEQSPRSEVTGYTKEEATFIFGMVQVLDALSTVYSLGLLEDIDTDIIGNLGFMIKTDAKYREVTLMFNKIITEIEVAYGITMAVTKYCTKFGWNIVAGPAYLFEEGAS